MPDPHSPFTILAQTQCHLLRCVQTPLLTVLQHFSLGKRTQVELDADQLHAFLRCLPRAVLYEALGEPHKAALLTNDNPFFDLDDPPRCTQCGQPKARHFALWGVNGRAPAYTCEPGEPTLPYMPPAGAA